MKLLPLLSVDDIPKVFHPSYTGTRSGAWWQTLDLRIGDTDFMLVYARCSPTEEGKWAPQRYWEMKAGDFTLEISQDDFSVANSILAQGSMGDCVAAFVAWKLEHGQ